MKALSDCKSGSYEIVSVSTDSGHFRRLLDLGFVRGTVVTVLRVTLVGGTLLISMLGTKLAIRKDAAALITVRQI